MLNKSVFQQKYKAKSKQTPQHPKERCKSVKENTESSISWFSFAKL